MRSLIQLCGILAMATGSWGQAEEAPSHYRPLSPRVTTRVAQVVPTAQAAPATQIAPTAQMAPAPQAVPATPYSPAPAYLPQYSPVATQYYTPGAVTPGQLVITRQPAMTTPAPMVAPRPGSTCYSCAPGPVVATPVRTYRPATPVTGYGYVTAGYYVRPGLVGRPSLYRPGQPVRNFFRYLTP